MFWLACLEYHTHILWYFQARRSDVRADRLHSKRWYALPRRLFFRKQNFLSSLQEFR